MVVMKVIKMMVMMGSRVMMLMIAHLHPGSCWLLDVTGCARPGATSLIAGATGLHREARTATKKNNVSPKQGWFSAISTTSRVFQHDKK